jgi:chemotaxis protein MotB
MSVKRNASDDGVVSPDWLLTFSDMVTLLLTFFVMIISITTIEPKSLSAVSDDESSIAVRPIIPEGSGVLGFSNPVLLAPLLEAALNVTTPPDASLDEDAFKAALFQLDPIDAANYARLDRQISEGVSIFKDERGLVIRWDNSIVFPEGSAAIREDGALLMGRLAALLKSMTLPVSLECHTDPLSPLEGGDGPAAGALSAKRAKTALELLVGLGVPESRFRLGAFGGSRPLTDDATRRGENSRLEVVIYQPPKSSWKG